MHNFFDIINGMDNVISLISILFTIATTVVSSVIAYIMGKHRIGRKKRRLRKLLRFNKAKNAKCEIVLPTLTGDLEVSTHELIGVFDTYAKDMSVNPDSQKEKV